MSSTALQESPRQSPGEVLRRQGRLAEAEALLRKAGGGSTRPDLLLSLGQVLIQRGKAAEAVSVLRELAVITPADAAVHKHLGAALRLAGRLVEAAGALQIAAELSPDDFDALLSLGNVCFLTGDFSSARQAYQRALAIKPGDPRLLINFAALLNELGETEEAIAVGCKAAALSPRSHPARYNLSLSLLTAGRMPEGWKLYESRWGCAGFLGKLMLLPQPLWDGGDPAGKTIFIRAEQGCGDTIQFCRYVTLLAERGARVILECQPELKPLLKGLPGASEVIARGEEPGPFDRHLPLLSLPHYFGTTLATIPAGEAYLRADDTRQSAWARRLADYAGLKCGLVWAGSPLHRNDRGRSIPPDLLTALSGIAGVQFFSLQKHAAALPEISGLVDLSGPLNDFADTAGLLANLDLLISVDTAAAHLAGAMGRPVWTLLPHVADWRWMRETDRSPWYPTMRLFRRNERADWAAVIGRVAGELRQLSAVTARRRI